MSNMTYYACDLCKGKFALFHGHERTMHVAIDQHGMLSYLVASFAYCDHHVCCDCASRVLKGRVDWARSQLGTDSQNERVKTRSTID